MKVLSLKSILLAVAIFSSVSAFAGKKGFINATDLADYLVKKGDVVNNYKVLAIAQDSVTVQLGSNVYKAGIGEILTEGSLNYNEVSNLGNKFGGVR